MRIAVVGSGISGLASAWLLSRRHEVVLFETQDRLGGHTHTQRVEVGGQELRVDTGFIVHNATHYPLLSRLLKELGVETMPTTMSFSVQNARSGLEYNATSLDGLFCQRRNLVSARFLGMLRDLFRFYRNAPLLLDTPLPGPTLGEYLDKDRYGKAFREDHLLPMASALWSAPMAQIVDFPARHLVQFMGNHQMLQVTNRPQWRVVCGGSATYIDAMAERWSATVRLRTPVTAVRRDAAGVEVELGTGRERFDRIVLACHSDQSLALLADADEREREILGAIRYQPNEAVLHTDANLMPRCRAAWAAWNAHVGADATRCTVSYCMNLLQGLPTDQPVIVTLNRSEEIDPGKVINRMHYEHPVFDQGAVLAQTRKYEIQGRRHTWFAGAYWGWGFHEDGVRSAAEVARGLGVGWPAMMEAVFDGPARVRPYAAAAGVRA